MHAAATSTQGFNHIKLQNLIQSQTDGGATKKTAAAEDDDANTTAKIAGTEAGDGMFGADVDLQSVTDSDEDDHKRPSPPKKDSTKVKSDVAQADFVKQTEKFKIVTGEDSDSMFEEHL